MGEAAARGTKEDRVAQAEERDEAIQEAVEKRTHADGLVWLAYEVTRSRMAVDDGGAFVRGADGGPVYEPDPDGWTPLMPDDVPDWLKEPGVVNELRGGTQVCKNPDKDGRWYRGVICRPAEGAINGG